MSGPAVANKVKGAVMLAKKDASVWDRVESFLPKGFSRILLKMRSGSLERLKRAGVL